MHLRPGPATSETSSTVVTTKRAEATKSRSLSHVSSVMVSLGPPEALLALVTAISLPMRMRLLGS